ncbi:MAG: SufD family Fe-S cluster assembly protein [Spirochaetaceae bacterium]
MYLPELNLNSIEEFKSFNIDELFKIDCLTKTVPVVELKKVDGFIQIDIVDGVPRTNNLTEGITISSVKTKKVDSFNPLINLNTTETFKIIFKTSPNKPVAIVNHITGKFSFISSNITYVVLNEVNVDILETSNLYNENEVFVNNNRGFNIEYSNVSYSRVEELSNKHNLIYNYNGFVNSGSLDVVTLNQSGNICMNIWDMDLFNEGTCNVNGVISLKDTMKHGTICKINHKDRETISNQEFRHVLDGRSFAMYDGDSIVLNNAKDSNTSQHSKAIMLSNGARILNKPRLNIFTSEVKAAHGASVGKLNSEDIFYLKQRGFPEVTIKKLLINAFVTDVIDRIKSDIVKEFFNEKK